ncbi:MAG: MG2 domain-containing protein, partial [Verrucomicrobiota bacterium]
VFERNGRGNLSSAERDRVRALQLLTKALPILDGSDAERAQFFDTLASAILPVEDQSWRLQVLTNLDELPDYSKTAFESRRAPVDADGNPVFHDVPDSWATAKSDGERWRWAIAQKESIGGEYRWQAKAELARFLVTQFEVSTFGKATDLNDDEKRRVLSRKFRELDDGETFAWLATGPKRFAYPDGQNPIALLKEVAAGSEDPDLAGRALDQLARIYLDRDQRVPAAEYLKEVCERFDPDLYGRAQLLNQIVGNFGRFDGTRANVAGEPAKIGFVHRNTDRVEFVAKRINYQQLLADLKAHLRTRPDDMKWNYPSLSSLGSKLQQEEFQHYIGDVVARWTKTLRVPADHLDARVEIETPLDEPGAFWLEAHVEGGNKTSIIVWNSDLVIVRKSLHKRWHYFVADAKTGEPIDSAKVEAFGYDKRGKLFRRWDDRVVTGSRSGRTDADGEIDFAGDDDKEWLVTATTKDGRFASLGFDDLSKQWYEDSDFDRVRIFAITDRPVYKPGDTVKFKAWVARASHAHDEDPMAEFKGEKVEIQINDARGEKVFEKTLWADEFGGVGSEFDVSKGAPLGNFSMRLSTRDASGSRYFRVEEYRKPEFEVVVEAPNKPIKLGERFSAKIAAHYYFGAPVTKGEARIKVKRTTTTARTFPAASWDWLYGSGYTFRLPEHRWYPNWSSWGCGAPQANWSQAKALQPELVLDSVFPLDEDDDGEIEVEIDTALAKELHGSQDHRYQIEVEVTDESRRVIEGSGSVTAARRPFEVFVSLDRGFYETGDVIQMTAHARSPDGRPVEGVGVVKFIRVRYDANGEPKETLVHNTDVKTDENGVAKLKFTAAAAGQFRVACELDSKGVKAEGARLIQIRGEGFNSGGFRFNDLELIPDKPTYRPGETARILVNTDRADGVVVLFIRPIGGAYRKPEILRLSGKSLVREIPVTAADTPNFFVEAYTVSDGKIFEESAEILVPPAKRALGLEVVSAKEDYRPDHRANLKLKLTGPDGRPHRGQVVLTVYDKAVEQISGGSNMPPIQSFFWKWRRTHSPVHRASFDRWFSNQSLEQELTMSRLGLNPTSKMFAPNTIDYLLASNGYGKAVVAPEPPSGLFRNRGASREEEAYLRSQIKTNKSDVVQSDQLFGGAELVLRSAPSQPSFGNALMASEFDSFFLPDGATAVRTDFADSIFWDPALRPDSNGIAEVSFGLPDNLTTWKVRAWALGEGNAAGQGETEFTTSKDLILRQQAPRFFVEGDVATLSANVHNYLETAQTVRVILELDGDALELVEGQQLPREFELAAGGESRIDWVIRAAREGEATVRMRALTKLESDAVELNYPVHVHGILKTESWSGVVTRDASEARLTIEIPEDRRPEQSKLEIRFSPSIAGAMVDALPYLVDYPYGCTEQTVNRFTPAVITRKILNDAGIDFADIRRKSVNLNPLQLTTPRERRQAEDWKTWIERSPVFNEAKLYFVIRRGLTKLKNMQNSDGGWGWFEDESGAHTTAVVVDALQRAQAAGASVSPSVISNGESWLKNHQLQKIQRMELPPDHKKHIGEVSGFDALVAMILARAKQCDPRMLDSLMRDKSEFSAYSKALAGLAMHYAERADDRDALLRNIEQLLIVDPENQSAHLRLPNDRAWWRWQNDGIETHAVYLKLLVAAKPNAPHTAGIVKFLLNNRDNGVYWKSTRDTALCIDAIADFFVASGEANSNLDVKVLLGDRTLQSVSITPERLFHFDNAITLEGSELTSGRHALTFQKSGDGPLYFNAYLTNFTKEDFITAAGLEVKVDRRLWRLTPKAGEGLAAGDRGQAIEQAVERFDRTPFEEGVELAPGDLVEVELIVESKNDYEYLLLEDPKAAGLEPVDQRSGYFAGLGAYRELREDRTAFFIRQLPKGQHQISYRMRAETPGQFSALPSTISAMYAPELRGNSDEAKVTIEE